MITEDYVNFDIAKLLKEKGFKGEGEHFYENNKIINFPNYWHRITPKQRYEAIEAPTLQMVMKWLREMYYLHITVHPGVSEYGFVWTYAIVFAKETGEGETYFYKISQITTPIVKSKSYKQAVEAAIKYCLENLI